MKVVLIGYGKMGEAIAPILESRGHQLIAAFRSGDEWGAWELKKADVAIEFTHPEAVIENLHKCLDAGIPTVTGTTGWNDLLPSIQQKTEETNGALFYASNFSLGMNLFHEIVRKAAALFAPYEEYRPAIREVHHIHKKDSPSGTAISLAENVLAEYHELNGWSIEPEQNALPIEAVREGDVKGYHELQLASPTDRITMSHEAFSREGFALGAVRAAEWLKGKRGVYTMRDLLNLTE